MESSAVSEQLHSRSWSCSSDLLLSHSHTVRASFETPHSPLGHRLRRHYEQATRSDHTNFNCWRCPRQQARQFWFRQKDISNFKVRRSIWHVWSLTDVACPQEQQLRLYWIKVQKCQRCSLNGLFNMKKSCSESLQLLSFKDTGKLSLNAFKLQLLCLLFQQ